MWTLCWLKFVREEMHHTGIIIKSDMTSALEINSSTYLIVAFWLLVFYVEVLDFWLNSLVKTHNHLYKLAQTQGD